MKDRIKEVRKALRMKQNAFALELHLAPNYISLIESGANPVSDKFIYKVCEAFDVNENWLRTGEGEMFVSKETEIASITATLYKENDSFILRLVKYLSEMTEEQKKVLKHFIEMMAKKEPLD